MRRSVAMAMALAAVLVSGCATPYVIHLKNGDVIESRDQPDFDRDSGFYEFEDLSGRRVRLNRDEIVKMEAR
jgi:Bacterial protein of unknown function (DUF903)